MHSSDSWISEIVNTAELQQQGVEQRWISRRPLPQHWSFSLEWRVHGEEGQMKTWDMTADERLHNFLRETRTEKSELKNLSILDAGCGNGQLTLALGQTGARVVGADVQPFLPPDTEQVVFVQGSFEHPLFKSESFDIVIANGSIHHSQDTMESFASLASFVKRGGRLYVWVYKKQRGLVNVQLKALDVSRAIISRLPSSLQKGVVNALTSVFYRLSRIRKGENSKRTREEIRTNVFDAFTPRYRSYHQPDEIIDWFKSAGFKDAFVTNPADRYGFGVLGIEKD